MASEGSVTEQLARAKALVRERAVAQGLGSAPKVGVVLGSGLGSFVERLEKPLRIPYGELPGMLPSTVPGHAGFLCLGELDQVSVACLAGRIHLYEGHAAERVVFGCWLLAELGCSAVLVTNAAGSVAPTLVPGDLMLIEDHINLTGHNPLGGPNRPAGQRFLDMTEAYDLSLRQAACRAALLTARELGEPFELKRGVYAGLLGPNYETPAEIRMLRALGADAVGMSTVNEVLALRHSDVRVGALSCITNFGAGLGDSRLSHSEVQATADRVRPRFECFLKHWVTAAA